jgi:hypothetical protein
MRIKKEPSCKRLLSKVIPLFCKLFLFVRPGQNDATQTLGIRGGSFVLDEQRLQRKCAFTQALGQGASAYWHCNCLRPVIVGQLGQAEQRVERNRKRITQSTAAKKDLKTMS